MKQSNGTAAPTIRNTTAPVDATTLVLDLRNFTPSLNSAPRDQAGINVYCHFLAEIYDICLNVSLTALPARLRPNPPLHISSTGDGVIVVFYGDVDHIRHGYLTALLLHAVLQRTCNAYNADHSHRNGPLTGFGIGLEFGTVSRILAQMSDGSRPVVDTFIGECINIAARAETVTKLFDATHTIVAERANEQLCKALLDTDYRALVGIANDPKTGDAERLCTQDRMNTLNRTLCLAYIQRHVLKGVDHPTALFRVQGTRVRSGNVTFQSLLRILARDGDEHYREVCELIDA